MGCCFFSGGKGIGWNDMGSGGEKRCLCLRECEGKLMGFLESHENEKALSGLKLKLDK
jgi:hypothetical protein